MEQGSTIAAISTPPGQGAIAVIRLSGEKALEICDKIFRPADNGPLLANRPANTIHFGRIYEKKALIDEVLVSIFRTPHSYTGEDVAEISCHGSVYIQHKILKLLLDNGAVLARPGEFTQRAFLNGKMDLTQAEAVADIVASESAAFHRVAIQQMRGGFSEEIKKLRGRLLDFISLVELELDFSEEDVQFADRSELKSLLDAISRMLEALTGSFAFGNALKKGIPVVIAGKPNVGKSTLLNALLKDERALVSEIPGTTRDSIEDVIHIDGISFRFTDTAGLRETSDAVEVMGIKRTMEKIRQAKIILLMVEATDTAGHINHLIEGLLVRPEIAEKSIILLLNKTDLLPGDRRLFEKRDFPPLRGKDHMIRISAKTNTGLDKLGSLLISMVTRESPGEGDVVITNLRHYEALRNAHEAVIRASRGLENQLPGDLLAMDIREVLHYLGEITGEITTDEILGNIFKNFCIGK